MLPKYSTTLHIIYYPLQRGGGKEDVSLDVDIINEIWLYEGGCNKGHSYVTICLDDLNVLSEEFEKPK